MSGATVMLRCGGARPRVTRSRMTDTLSSAGMFGHTSAGSLFSCALRGKVHPRLGTEWPVPGAHPQLKWTRPAANHCWTHRRQWGFHISRFLWRHQRHTRSSRARAMPCDRESTRRSHRVYREPTISSSVDVKLNFLSA